MDSEKRQNLKQGLILALFVLLLIPLINFAGYDTEDVRVKMEEYLYDRYGEEFVVDRIGTRSGYYEARIYPKSIIGTHKEGDPYYYSQAGIKIERRLGNVGDGYDIVMLNIEGEEHLKPKVREIFGDRVKLKTDIKYSIRKEDNDYFTWQIVSGFEDLLEKAINDSDNHRIELKLYIYIFDRIQSEEEKEQRREEIFEFVQYLKGEGLYEYLELAVIFIDERVLAPSYDTFRREVRFSDKERKEIEGKRVDLPPMELRERMSNDLQEEIDEMSEEELLARMRRLRKDDLSYEGIEKNNAIYFTKVYSIAMLEGRYRTSLERSPDLARDYNNLEDVRIRSNLEYVYIN